MHERAKAALGLLALSGCQYDIDRLYEHTAADAGASARPDVSLDPGTPDAGPAPSLIYLFQDRPAVDAECIACAEQACTAVEASCAADPECREYTQCVARSHDLAGQSACRQSAASWVRADAVRDREHSGPYGQCVFRNSCAAQCEGDADLSCVGKYAWPTTSASSVPVHLYLTSAVDAVSPLPGVEVKVCGVTDFACKTPTATGYTDERGYVMLPLQISSFSRSFDGFLELRGEGLYPTLLKFGWDIGLETTHVVSVVNESLFRHAISTFGVVPDPERGMLQLRMLGCSGLGVSGVSFSAESADARTRSWYLDRGLPRFEATATNFVGSGGILDVPEVPLGQGRTRVTAKRGEQTVASADAPIRVGMMTVVLLAPLSR